MLHKFNGTVNSTNRTFIYFARISYTLIKIPLAHPRAMLAFCLHSFRRDLSSRRHRWQRRVSLAWRALIFVLSVFVGGVNRLVPSWFRLFQTIVPTIYHSNGMREITSAFLSCTIFHLAVTSLELHADVALLHIYFFPCCCRRPDFVWNQNARAYKG